MKRLLVALALLAAPAFAATDPPAAGEPYQQFRSPDRYKHVAVITPGRWAVLGGNLSQIRQSMFAHMGTIFDKMQMAGLEVHYYNSDFFETVGGVADKDHREMWTDLGAKYSLAIVLWPTSSVAAFSRYICADSTNVQLLVVGGADNGGTLTWGGNDAYTDSSFLVTRGLVDYKGQPYETGSGLNGAALVTNDGIDTLWAFRFSSGRRVTTLPAGIDSVVRLLRPITFPTTTTWVQNADSVNSNMPGVVSGIAGDSVARVNDYLGPTWRVKYTNYSGQGNANWINSLATSSARGAGDGGLSPRSVYFVKMPTQFANIRPYPMFVWALICRFTKAAPIKWSYDWDDVTDKFGENGGLTPNAVPLAPPRWRQTAIDSALRGLASYGIVPTMAVNA